MRLNITHQFIRLIIVLASHPLLAQQRIREQIPTLPSGRAASEERGVTLPNGEFTRMRRVLFSLQIVDRTDCLNTTHRLMVSEFHNDQLFRTIPLTELVDGKRIFINDASISPDGQTVIYSKQVEDIGGIYSGMSSIFLANLNETLEANTVVTREILSENFRSTHSCAQASFTDDSEKAVYTCWTGMIYGNSKPDIYLQNLLDNSDPVSITHTSEANAKVADVTRPVISGDGSTIAFAAKPTPSGFSSEIQGGLLHTERHIFYIKLGGTNEIKLASVNSVNNETIYGQESNFPALSHNGKFVVFEQIFDPGKDLGLKDKNNQPLRGRQIIRKDLMNNQVLVVSIDENLDLPTTRPAFKPGISSAGDRIIFVTDGYLTHGNAQGLSQIYQKTIMGAQGNLATGELKLVSAGDNGLAFSRAAFNGAISRSGDAVVWSQTLQDPESGEHFEKSAFLKLFRGTAQPNIKVRN